MNQNSKHNQLALATVDHCYKRINVVGFSFYDKNGKLHVDCTECVRHQEKTCSPGNNSNKPGCLGCFCGELMPDITPGDLRKTEGL